jgi:hypothetical protein
LLDIYKIIFHSISDVIVNFHNKSDIVSKIQVVQTPIFGASWQCVSTVVDMPDIFQHVVDMPDIFQHIAVCDGTAFPVVAGTVFSMSGAVAEGNICCI